MSDLLTHGTIIEWRNSTDMECFNLILIEWFVFSSLESSNVQQRLDISRTHTQSEFIRSTSFNSDLRSVKRRHSLMSSASAARRRLSLNNLSGWFHVSFNETSSARFLNVG